MKAMGWLPIILAVAAFAGQSSPQRQKVPPTFSINISTSQPSVKVGSEVVVDINLTNKTGRIVWIYWPNNEEARPDEYIPTVLDEGSKRPPLTSTGRNLIDHDPGITIGNVDIPNRDVGDGEIIKQKIVITKFYDLSKPGKYTIQLSRGEGETAVKSNTITVTVTP
jgi:hypothetical protein